METCRGEFEEVCPPRNRSLKVTESQNQDPALNSAAQMLGLSLRQTEDELIRDMLSSTASFQNATGGTNGDNPTNIAPSDCNRAVRTLLGNNAYQVFSTIEGENRFGTAPVRNSYFALCSTDLTDNLQNMQGFKTIDQYPNQSRILPSEWGSISNLRFFVSSIGAKLNNASNLGRDVYKIFCVGLQAYCIVNQDSFNDQFIYLPPQFSGPLAQFATVGWKMATVPRITNDAWVLAINCTLQ